MRPKAVFARFVQSLGWLLFIVAVSAAPAGAAEGGSEVPAWLAAHVGENDGEIAPIVLQRARALYHRKLRDGAVANPCYFAFDATRPADLGHGRLGRRFYIICESQQSFRAIASGHGGGRDLKGLADFANGRVCAKNFSNAQDSKLTTGGAYVTGEAKTSFKGYFRDGARGDAAFLRTFIQFDGEGDAANAREREIGGHPAELLRNVCLRKDPRSPYADHDGFVPFGSLTDYSGGRSNGCTSWTASDAAQVIPIMKGRPTTLYIYPESRDIAAIVQAVKSGQGIARAGLYWSPFCLKQIHTPNFWPKSLLEPIVERYKRDHPPPPPRPLPLCKGR